MPPLSMRKQPSGALKRKKRKKLQKFLKSQANAILKFVKKKPENSETVVESRKSGSEEDVIGQSQSNVVPEHIDEQKQVLIRGEGSEEKKTHICEGVIGQSQSNVFPEHFDEGKDNDEQKQVLIRGEGSEEKKKHTSEDVSDPGNWGNVDMKMRDLLVKNGPTTRLSTDYQFPKDGIGRRFSQAFYTRELVNGEKQDRRWLVYSESLDKVFCFCCKLFRPEKNGGGNLATTGYNDWRNLSTRLKEHENFHDHFLCMIQWKELEVRLHKNQTIDKLIKL
ncbi:PREDICTED: zinc finger MYM-type protein 5-like [Camelina sativa]|uniref:Zinc finger MYM-type protein 5-like n=1 Tax=Camelina sativa TaxID=90675 RepID=A0ABM0Z5S0_CAMSA|nr:PREDICTED: zinc finger MYM-type protein 5-like [Camelina sativa]